MQSSAPCYRLKGSQRLAYPANSTLTYRLLRVGCCGDTVSVGLAGPALWELAVGTAARHRARVPSSCWSGTAGRELAVAGTTQCAPHCSPPPAQVRSERTPG